MSADRIGKVREFLPRCGFAVDSLAQESVRNSFEAEVSSALAGKLSSPRCAGCLELKGVVMKHCLLCLALVPSVLFALSSGLSAPLPLGAGDIHRPVRTTADTPCVLLIHGGGWTGMSRKDVIGIADFLQRDLGCVVYNVDYRLASKEFPWPACGEDCIRAAKFMFTGEFAAASGVRPRKIWVMGGSAGGHLALWTGLSLPSKQVAGIVSISGIADLRPDLARNFGRYRSLFGGREPTAERLASADPLRLIRPNGPRILCTHADGDCVVPIESARNFAKAYRMAGNEIEIHEYPTTHVLGLTGHCIWIPGSRPHRLIPMLERRIADFMGL